jgi:hypothetical protein
MVQPTVRRYRRELETIAIMTTGLITAVTM